MGARGKKRKRADGSVAGIRQTSFYAPSGASIDDPVAEVPVDAMREIMPFMLRDGNSGDSGAEEDDAAVQRAMDQVADKYDIQDDALEFRATRLGWLLESSRPDLLNKLADGTLSIDTRLLEFAATFDPWKPEAMIKWVADEFPKPE